MKATFTNAIRYFVDVTCASPLRTGGSAKDPQSILRDADRIPFLQGTSLAGAFRSWREDSDLFADNTRKSPLMFSDLCLEDRDPVLRPRLRIDGKTGTAAGTAKFDVAAMPTGTTGSFQMVWTGDADPAPVAEKIERYLCALDSGEITLGALKANGFGRISLSVRRRIYRMTDPADLEAWLLGFDDTSAVPIELARQMEHSVLFTVTASAPHLLVKGSGSDRGSGGAHFVQMTEAGRRIVPGSALKGTLRSQMARICPFFGRRAEELELLFGRASGRKGDTNAPGIAGPIRFSDGVITDGKAFRTNRIRINRLTGSVMGTGFFQEEAAAGQLRFEIRVPADRKAGCALLLYALRDLGLGLFELGSGTSVGRGRLLGLRVQIQAPNAQASLGCSGDDVKLSDPSGLIAGWEQALRGGTSI